MTVAFAPLSQRVPATEQATTLFITPLLNLVYALGGRTIVATLRVSSGSLFVIHIGSLRR
jgi:hypothetical protein